MSHMWMEESLPTWKSNNTHLFHTVYFSNLIQLNKNNHRQQSLSQCELKRPLIFSSYLARGYKVF